MHCTLEMFSSIIHAVGSIHLCIAQTLAMSVSCLISHLTVSDLNTCAAVYLHFLLIYHRQHCNPPSFHFRHTVRSHTVSPIWPAVTAAITVTAETTMCLRLSLKIEDHVGMVVSVSLLFFHYVDIQYSLHCALLKSNTAVMCNIYEQCL